MAPDEGTHHDHRQQRRVEDLAVHVRQLQDTRPGELDARLTELLIHVYPTTVIQNG